MTARPAPDLFDAFGLPPLAGPVPDSVLAGLGAIAAGAPLWGSPTEWANLIDRIRTWACRWNGVATAAGWDVAALYGVSAEAPQVRRDIMGGAWLACRPGYQTLAIDHEAIRIVGRTAARLSIYPPAPGGVLAWELTVPAGCGQSEGDK